MFNCRSDASALRILSRKTCSPCLLWDPSDATNRCAANRCAATRSSVKTKTQVFASVQNVPDVSRRRRCEISSETLKIISSAASWFVQITRDVVHIACWDFQQLSHHGFVAAASSLNPDTHHWLRVKDIQL